MKKLLLRFRQNRFLNSSLHEVETVNADRAALSRIPLHLITVAFNNTDVLKHQLQLVRKNIADQCVHIIVDNSSDLNMRIAIKELCLSNGAVYISLPKNPFGTGSPSHAASLKWICKNYINVVRPAYFGFIDHDIYPVKKHSVIAHLEQQGIYGHLQERESYWYLWPGLCFFSSDKIRNIELNFDPCTINGTGLDTGGSNWEPLYSKIDRDTIQFPAHSYVNLREGNIAQSDKLELIGEWLHSFNGSYWMDVKPKENDLAKYLEQYY